MYYTQYKKSWFEGQGQYLWSWKLLQKNLYPDRYKTLNILFVVHPIKYITIWWSFEGQGDLENITIEFVIQKSLRKDIYPKKKSLVHLDLKLSAVPAIRPK